MKFNTICDLWFLWFLNKFENSLDNIKIHNYILLSSFWGEKYIDPVWFLADCKFSIWNSTQSAIFDFYDF